MDMRWLYFSARGRLSAKAFRHTYLGLLVIGVITSLAPLVGTLIGLVCTYATISITTKRLHDMGRSGWLQVAPMLPWAAVVVWAATQASGNPDLVDAISKMVQTNAVFLGALVLSTLVSLGFLVWLAFTPGSTEANAYGEESTTVMLQ